MQSVISAITNAILRRSSQSSGYSATYRPNGLQERQRRLVQIARGELTQANGLINEPSSDQVQVQSAEVLS